MRCAPKPQVNVGARNDSEGRDRLPLQLAESRSALTHRWRAAALEATHGHPRRIHAGELVHVLEPPSLARLRARQRVRRQRQLGLSPQCERRNVQHRLPLRVPRRDAGRCTSMGCRYSAQSTMRLCSPRDWSPFPVLGWLDSLSNQFDPGTTTRPPVRRARGSRLDSEGARASRQYERACARTEPVANATPQLNTAQWT